MAGNSGDILEDRIVSTADAYSVEATSAPSSGQIIQAVAFRLAGGGDTNTQGLTAPTNLSASASGTQINLTWTASTDNIGVNGYIVERCSNAGCDSYAQIAEVTGTSYADTGPFCTSCGYAYRVRATDAANLQSSYSNTSTATSAAAN
jgi:hypothetical protein